MTLLVSQKHLVGDYRKCSAGIDGCQGHSLSRAQKTNNVESTVDGLLYKLNLDFWVAVPKKLGPAELGCRPLLLYTNELPGEHI